MASLKTAKDLAERAPRSKDLPWFQSNIGSSLTPSGRQLLEGYGGIASEEVVPHIYKVVSAFLPPHSSNSVPSREG